MFNGSLQKLFFARDLDDAMFPIHRDHPPVIGIDNESDIGFILTRQFHPYEEKLPRYGSRIGDVCNI